MFYGGLYGDGRLDSPASMPVRLKRRPGGQCLFRFVYVYSSVYSSFTYLGCKQFVWQNFNLRYTYEGQIDPQGYKFIYNFVKCGDNKISFGDFPKMLSLSK